MKKLLLALSLPVFCLSTPARAHFNLLTPPPASAGTDGGKGPPPCGDNPSPGTATPAQGGHPLMVSLEETVQHTGFYRFALTLDSLSSLPVDNVVKDANGKVLPPNGTTGNSATADYEDPAVFPVLADHLFVHTQNNSGTLKFMTQLALPNVNCDKCTLQVIEFMADHPPNNTGTGANVGGGYFYHHCATLKITADPALPLFNSGGAGGGGAGGAAAGGAAGSGGSIASVSGGSGGAPAAGGAPTSTDGGGGQTSSGGGGQTSSGGSAQSSSGGTVTSTGGSTPASSGGASSGGASNAGPSGPAASDSGCSCSFKRRSGASRQIAVLLFGLLVMSRRRARRRSN